MTSGHQAQGLIEELNCPICLDFFTAPVTLNCGHNFCRSCITLSWDTQKTNTCPKCRQVIADRNLKVNWALVKIVEKAQKLNLASTQTEIRSQCEKHREELKLFCESDKKLLCLVCRDAREHRGHSFLPIEEAVEIYKVTIPLMREDSGQLSVSSTRNVRDTDTDEKRRADFSAGKLNIL
uniref:RING-type E3 ubiquitin transferase n=1 Tax=Callorhinchus milii TaxID=7868 RepID=A0A4W3H398_CALMI